MKHVGLLEAEANLANLCREVASTGHELIIEQDGEPLVRLVPAGVRPDPAKAESVCEALRLWDALNPDDDGDDFELPPRNETHRDPLSDYWK
jgi:antitoxin (DNA-binding transcriptional repressor) of toxin-antitoxin stability system